MPAANSAGTERANLLGLPNTSGAFPYHPGYSEVGRVVAVGRAVSAWEASVPALPADFAATVAAKAAARPRLQVVEGGGAAKPAAGEATAKPNATRGKEDPIVTREAYENLHEQLATTEELLEDALAERGED